MTITFFIQILISILLVSAILIQARGTGIGGAFGGGGELYRTKRGFEKTLFVATIILAILFIVNSLISVIVG